MPPPPPLRGLACLVLAHEKAPQVAMLLDRVSASGARCFLHLDARAGRVRQELAPRLPPGTWLAPQAASARARWGGYGMIEASLLLLRQALRDPETRHVCLLSGNHLPVQPAARIAGFLFDGRQHMDLRLAAAEPYDQESLRRFWYPRLAGREETSWLVRTLNRHAWRLGRRDLARGLRGMTPMVGKQWWHMTADCARELLGFLDANSWYEAFFRRVHIPDEAFFQTLLGASRFAEEVGEPSSWQRMDGYSAAMLGMADVAAARASGRPFARKFDAARAPEAARLALQDGAAASRAAADAMARSRAG